MRQLILDIRPDTPPSFTNFLVGANAEALALLQGMADPGFAGSHVIYLWGEQGVGKSHLLQSWASLVNAPCFFQGPLPQDGPAMLAVDDVDGLDATDQIRLFSLLNSAREEGGRVLVAGHAPPGRLDLRPDLATRLAQGLVFRLHPLTDTDKARALAIRAEAHGMQLPEDVVRYMLRHCRRNLPHLLATVDALDSLSLSRKRPISLPLLRELLHAPATS